MRRKTPVQPRIRRHRLRICSSRRQPGYPARYAAPAASTHQSPSPAASGQWSGPPPLTSPHPPGRRHQYQARPKPVSPTPPSSLFSPRPSLPPSPVLPPAPNLNTIPSIIRITDAGFQPHPPAQQQRQSASEPVACDRPLRRRRQDAAGTFLFAAADNCVGVPPSKYQRPRDRQPGQVPTPSIVSHERQIVTLLCCPPTPRGPAHHKTSIALVVPGLPSSPSAAY